jgi:hypothetical protein
VDRPPRNKRRTEDDKGVIGNAAPSMNPANKRIMLVDDDATFHADMRGIIGDERHCEFIEAEWGQRHQSWPRASPDVSM